MVVERSASKRIFSTFLGVLVSGTRTTKSSGVMVSGSDSSSVVTGVSVG